MQDYGGTKHTGVPVKTLKKLLKKAGLKVSGKKATLTRRAKKARLLKGGLGPAPRSSVASVFKQGNVITPQGTTAADKRGRDFLALGTNKAIATTASNNPSSVAAMLARNNALPPKVQEFYNFLEYQKVLSEEQKQKLKERALRMEAADLANGEEIRRQFKEEFGKDIDEVDVSEANPLFNFLEELLIGSVRKRGGAKNKRSRRR